VSRRVPRSLVRNLRPSRGRSDPRSQALFHAARAHALHLRASTEPTGEPFFRPPPHGSSGQARLSLPSTPRRFSSYAHVDSLARTEGGSAWPSLDTRVGADPFVYLRDVVERLPVTAADNLGTLTPRAWLAARQPAPAAAATS
jgi:hypothetical protein